MSIGALHCFLVGGVLSIHLRVLLSNQYTVNLAVQTIRRARIKNR